MGSAGVNIGKGIQKVQVVFLFQTQSAYESFVDKGWQADAAADAAAGDKGGVVTAEFVDGMAAYRFTDKGLMLQANLSGTKYYKFDKLNEE